MKLKKLKIAVNTRLLLHNKLEGIGWFTYETLKRICRQHPEVEFYFLFDRNPHPSFIFSNNITPYVILPPARHPFLFYLWFEWSIPLVLKKINPDLFLSPDGYVSLKTKTPTLSVIHDINFEHFPQHLPYLSRKYYLYFFPKFARKASRIATVSEFSKNDISSQYGIASEKIDVVYNGFHENYIPVNEKIKEQFKSQHTHSQNFFLYVGSLHPRKNLINLMLGFEQFRTRTPNKTKLLIVGDKYWWTRKEETILRALQYKDDIIFKGRLSVEELNQAYNASLALTYVSYFEGFGIPILEAFASETAVITSKLTSMPEVGGDACYYADPYNPESIADQMIRVLEDPAERESKISKGRDQLKKFSWDKSADALWKSIEKTIYNLGE